MAPLFFSLFLASALSLAQTAAPARPKPGSIAGSVIRADNFQPIKKAKLSLTPTLDDESAKGSPEEVIAAMRERMVEAETDESGHFLISDVLPGKYRMTVEKSGFIANDAGVRNGGLPFTVTPGDSLKSIVIQMRPGGAITGRVLNEDGDPMPNVSIVALRYGYIDGKRKLIPEGQAGTNDLGEYRIFGLTPRKYYVRATAPNRDAYSIVTKSSANKSSLAYWPIFFPDAKSAETAGRLEVKPSEEARANFTLVPLQSYSVSGKLMGIAASGAAGKGTYGLAMLMSKESEGMSGMAMLSPTEPTFSIGPVSPGEYQLIGFAAEIKNPGSATQSIENIRMAHETIKITSADITGVNVSLEEHSPLQLTGRIRLDPVPAVAPDLSSLYVTFDSSDEDTEIDNALAGMGSMFVPRASFDDGQTAKDGRFKAKFSPASSVVHAHLNARGGGFEDYYSKSVLLGGRDVLESGFAPANVTPGATLQVVVSANGGRVEGAVLDSNKKPVTGAFVACVPVDPKLRARRELYITDTTNQQGHYVLRGLRPGTYKLYAFDEVDPGAIYSPEFLKPFEDMGESIDVKEKNTLTKPLQVLHQTED